MRPGRAAILAGLLGLGYLCHLVSAILTIFGLVILSLTTPGSGSLARCRWTAIMLAPLVPLGIIYHRLMQTAGEVHPMWGNVPNLWSLRSWYHYLESADPLNFTLNPSAFPFVEWTSAWFRLLHPPLWVAVGVLLWVMGMVFTRTDPGESPTRTYRGWLILTLFLMSSWAAAPSDFGVEHGLFLRIRLLPFALMAIIPMLRLPWKYVSVWVGAGAVVVAVAVQSAIVWEYALTSNRLASIFMEATPYVGTGKRIGTLRIDMPHRFNVRFPHQAPPLLHIDSMLGIGTGNIVWHNYEALEYYFPVKYRDELGRSLAQEFEDLEVVNLSAPGADGLINRWARLLAEYQSALDVLVVWGADPRLDDINARWYGPEPVFQCGNLRVFHKSGERGPPLAPPTLRDGSNEMDPPLSSAASMSQNGCGIFDNHSPKGGESYGTRERPRN